MHASDVDGDEPAGGAVGWCPMDGSSSAVVPADANLGLVFATPAGAEEESNHGDCA
jgi:hypothetical protein